MKLRRIIPLFLGLQMFMAPVNPGFYSEGEIIDAAANAPAFLSANHSWVDSVMGQMSLEEKIAQLLMVQAYSNRDLSHLDELKELVEKHKVGGIIFFQGGPLRQAHMTNVLQESADVPLLIAMDAEWGLGMRLDSVISYPRQMELGAIRDNRLIFRFGQELAQQLKDLGVHMNFAPVADVNNNPGNPVINTRSFGEVPEQVAGRVNAAFLGMQTGGVLVTAKHFPGHGDTRTDSHYDLPVLNFNRERLDSVELYPFRHAIRSGLTGIMVAHLQVNALDKRLHRPASLSDTIVTHLLQEELGFQGLIVTDAMNMKGVSDHYQPGDAETEALKAGNDIILMPSDVPKTIHHIRRAVHRGEIPESQVDRSCRKILLAKKWLGLDTLRTVQTEDLYKRLNDRRYLPLREQMAAQALTLVKNDRELVPFTGLEKMTLATINIGTSGPTTFTKYLDQYKTGQHYYYGSPSDFPADTILAGELNKYNTLIISTYYTRSYGNNFDIPPGVKEFINQISFDGNLVFNHFGYPYALGVLGDLENTDAILIANTNHELNQQFAAQALFGGTTISGRLPVSVGSQYPAGTGHETNGGTRLSYGSPEGVGMSYESLQVIEEIIYKALAMKATPGCQVLVARKGRVVWQESYGHHTYQRRQPVRNTDLYDLASITKIASTIPSLMRLQDQQRFSADSMLGSYFPALDTSQKAKLQIRDILTHQAGLQAWIPFYMETIEPMDTSQRLISTQFNFTYPYKLGPAAYANRNIMYKDSVYEREYSPDYPLQVADHLYLRRGYRDTVYRRILESPLGDQAYLYSDLGYYYLFRAVEEITDTLFYPYNWFSFYGPLGAETLGFLPLNRFSRNRIVPTENDLIFRRQLVHGHVHDPGAAMLGGVCGHAGLFSNANDLAKLMQMYLNYGTYGGERFIDSATIAAYTRCQFCDKENRRALGFDRPVTDKEDEGPACNSASEVSFGHSGFTGTITWVDPKYDLLYIFLSNRIHPDQFNIQLITENVRTEIQEQIYRSLVE
jgi:beta-glucosidase-like glycosyl hydrolase/CubicO group peptidase (beta-lactamase class C family)